MKKTKIKIKLEKYEEICPTCNGEGHGSWWWCIPCNGEGKIDWIDKLKSFKGNRKYFINADVHVEDEWNVRV